MADAEGNSFMPLH